MTSDRAGQTLGLGSCPCDGRLDQLRCSGGISWPGSRLPTSESKNSLLVLLGLDQDERAMPNGDEFRRGSHRSNRASRICWRNYSLFSARRDWPRTLPILADHGLFDVDLRDDARFEIRDSLRCGVHFHWACEKLTSMICRIRSGGINERPMPRCRRC